MCCEKYSRVPHSPHIVYPTAKASVLGGIPAKKIISGIQALDLKREFLGWWYLLLDLAHLKLNIRNSRRYWNGGEVCGVNTRNYTN